MIIIMNTGLHGDLSQISIVKYAAFTDLTQAFLVCKQIGSSLRSESDVYAVICFFEVPIFIRAVGAD